MTNQNLMMEIYQSSFNDELEKLSAKNKDASGLKAILKHVKKHRGKYGIGAGVAIGEALRQRNRNRNIITGSLDKAED